MSTLKTKNICDLFCMNVQRIFLKHAHWHFKKDSWVILGIISGNCIYWHQRKLQFFTKVLMTWGLVACCLRQAVATENENTCTVAHTLIFFKKNNSSHWPSALLSSPIHSTFLCGLTSEVSLPPRSQCFSHSSLSYPQSQLCEVRRVPGNRLSSDCLQFFLTCGALMKKSTDSSVWVNHRTMVCLNSDQHFMWILLLDKTFAHW